MMKGHVNGEVHMNLGASGSLMARPPRPEGEDRKGGSGSFMMSPSWGGMMGKPGNGSGAMMRGFLKSSEHMSGTGAMMRQEKGEGKMSSQGANALAEMITKMETRATAVLKHDIQNSFNLSKRICNKTNTDQSAITACLSQAKTDLKASVDAAIDASFGS